MSAGISCVYDSCTSLLALYVCVKSIGLSSRLQAQSDRERFLNDLRRNVEKPMGFDAVLRVRTSTGEAPS